ncbi:MAG TPA: acyl carrier protein [Vicinamibacterales bacterium]|nr:acyl carrier protein [Vicinamibacterales bacterium]
MFGQASTDLRDDESLLDRGLIDSTGVLELVGFLERRYAISIDDRELVPDNLDSIARIVAFVEAKARAQVKDIAS